MATDTAFTPPTAAPVQYATPHGTRWQNELAGARDGTLEFPDDPHFVGPWILGECIGKGASGRVRIARHRQTGQLAAVKILPLMPAFNSQQSIRTRHVKAERFRHGIDKEIITMKLMRHPNIMRMFDVYEGEKELFLVLEYVEGGELFDYLVNHGRMSPQEALSYFKQIISGLHFAHTFSIVHRDLKPENILIQSLNPPLIKIADWGMAAFSPPSAQLGTSCGSPHYASPEIIAGESYEGPASDIWSCGVILFALLTGRLPFDDKDVGKLLKKVRLGQFTIPSWIDAHAANLLSRMLVVDPLKRITMLEILGHPWMRTPTPGVVCILPPSIEDLASPLSCLSAIDRDILESLLVICDKQADMNNLVVDLLSPPGHGSYTKAFYYLLSQHRQATLEGDGIFHDISSALGKTVTRQYSGPPSRATTPVIPERHKTIPDPKPAPVGPLPSRPPVNRARTIECDAPSSRLHAPSPRGSRANPRQYASVPMPPPFAFSGRSSLPHPMPAERSDIPPPVPFNTPVPDSPIVVSQQHHPTIPNMSLAGLSMPACPQTAYDSLPRVFYRETRIPGPTPASPALGHVAAGNASSSPRAPVTQRRTALYPDDTPNRPASRQRYRTADGSPLRSEVMGALGSSLPRHQDTRTRRRAESALVPRTDEKENRPVAYPSREATVSMARHPMGKVDWPGPLLEDKSTGLGFDKTMSGIKIEKRRPPPLELVPNNANDQRVTSNLLLSPTAHNPVGELKGWFSNLFNWKQSHVFYSHDILSHTRAEVSRLLVAFGVSVIESDDHDSLAPNHDTQAFKCVVEDGCNGAHKGVRFRVEFSPCAPSSPGSFYPPSPLSPTTPSGISSRKSAKAIAGTATGGLYECAIVLVQEKGSVTTFRTVVQRLREEWRLDALQTPGTQAGQGVRAWMDTANAMSVDQLAV